MYYCGIYAKVVFVFSDLAKEYEMNEKNKLTGFKLIAMGKTVSGHKLFR